MKKLFFAGLMSLGALVMISCLEGGSNVRTQNGIPGIVRFDMKNMKTVISSPEFGAANFYDPQFETQGFTDGDCILFGYTVDLSDDVNLDYATTGLLHGSVSGPVLVNQYPCYSYMLRDTAVLIDGEQPVAYAVSENGYNFYYSDKWFMSSDFRQYTGQETNWLLYYDGELPTETVEGKEAYTLFVRAVLTKEGTAPIIEGTMLNTFNASNFFDGIQSREKSKGKTEAYFRICYIKEIKEDGSFTWEHSNLLYNTIFETETDPA
ncbi:MAG: hypothetical protein LBS05_05220 [Tannerellaceae bacterium]|jgi:hypothetical protein|nr:hypothetical protein [Tannerellaceae bacterium]